MKKSIFKKTSYIYMYISFLKFFLLLIFQPQSLAATPKLITRIEDAFKTIEKWFLTIATPAAAVAIGTGVFIKKFSFGDEERIRTGKKIIRSSLFSYAFFLAIDLILSAVQTLVK